MTSSDGERHCAWCAAVAGPDDRQCPSCGAALAQREDLGGVVIAGVTGIDPALQGLDGPPMRIPGASPTQGMASGVAVAAAMGGPVALAALGGIAAVAAAEYLGAKRTDGLAPPDLDHLGQPSELALRALELAEQDGRGEPAPAAAVAVEPAPDPWRDLPLPPEVAATVEPAPDPWRDLPAAPATEDEGEHATDAP